MTPNVAALFDLDGVIIDTEPQYSAFWRGVGQMFQPDMPDFAESIKGQTLTNIYATHFPDAARQKEISRLLVAHEEQMAYPEIPGALAFVRSLRESGIGVAVATSSNREKMQQVYRHLPELPLLFDAILTSEDAQRSKPAPDCYLNAAACLGVPIGCCTVFEDSLNGLRAACASGARVVALSTSLTEEELRPFTSVVIPDFSGATPELLF